jgi:diadenosine tetraphosphate (Ap4A) HIT family hydrolase
MAEIHPQLLKDCLILGRFSLCYLLLMRDANYPWFILVPDREGISEIYQLSEADQQQLLSESSLLAEVLMQSFHGDKMNIAALGNIVPQCHIHHVVRYHNDATWPAPIWGTVPGKAYSDHELHSVVDKIKKATLAGFKYQENRNDDI